LGGDQVIRQAISCDICATEKKQTNHWFVAYDQGGELRVSGWNSRNRLRPGSKHLCGQTCLHKLVDDFMAKLLAVKPSLLNSDEVEVEESAQPIPSRSDLRSNLHSDLRAAARPEFTSEKRPSPGQEIRQEPRAAVLKAPSRASRKTESPSIQVHSAAMKAIESFETDDSLTSDSIYGDDFESSARLLSPEEAAVIKRNMAMPVIETISRPAVEKPRPSVEMMQTVSPARVMPARSRLEEPEQVAEESPRFASRNWRAEAWEREREREREQRTVNQHAKIPTRRRVN